jgi:arabinofuranosyltransferase
MKNTKKLLKIILPILMFLFLFTIIIKCAWICDDAYISFRYIKNLINGDGLTWNIGERVQAFTNPLYIFCIIPFYALTKNMYLSSIVLSVGLTMGAVFIGLTSKNKRNIPLLCLFIIILTCSKSFIDYSTSGLENPMTFFLVAIFYRLYFSYEKPYESKSFLKLCLIASLISLNRIDSLILVIPPLVYVFFKKFKAKKIYLGIVGFIPFIIWEIFSFIYYGFLIPNTAVAKLNNTTNISNVLLKGLRYILTTNLYGDYITIIVILIAICCGLFAFKKQCKYSFASLGVLLYVLYVVYVGGDYMIGRFLSAPFFLSVIIIYNVAFDFIISLKTPSNRLNKYIIATAIIVLIMGCMPQTSTITSKVKYNKTKCFISTNYDEIPCDERRYYYNDTGLSYYLANIYVSGYDPNRAVYKWGRLGRFLEPGAVYIEYSLGFKGYFCPDDTVLIDCYGLCEPLLARIPAAPNQRVGHYIRLVPDGYKETIETGVNVISNPALKQYYDKLNLIVRGKIFDPERIKTIFEMNLGKYDYLMDEYVQSVEYQQYLNCINEKFKG